MSDLIQFVVNGIATPQGSKTAIPGFNGGRPRVIDAGSHKAHKAHNLWRKSVKEAAEAWLVEHPQPPLDEPLSIKIAFILESPVSDPYRTRHAKKPDGDKLIRSIFDALTDSKLVVDDSRFWAIEVQKIYAHEGQGLGAVILIRRSGDAEREDRERLKQKAKEART